MNDAPEQPPAEQQATSLTDADTSTNVAGTAAASAAESKAVGLDYEQASLAYHIIEALLEHTRVTQDLVALMAQVLGEEVAEALTQTPHWNAYMDSRRVMERTRRDVEKFAEIWTKLAGNHPSS